MYSCFKSIRPELEYVHKKINQILDFDERHCINEYKSGYVLRCRSTITTEFISKRAGSVSQNPA